MNFPLPVRLLLWPLALVYGGYVRLRAFLYHSGLFKQKRLHGAVISVGNLTVGGTGKTPMVLWLAEKLIADGKRVAILSRGYRGANGTSDEIELMKRRLQGKVLFGVGKDRFAAGRRLEAAEPIDIFLLDDGFQHLPLARDLDILMLDGSRKLKDQWLLPAGELREPVAACRRADLLVVTRKTERPEIEANGSHKFPIFYGQTRLLGFRRLGNAPELPYVNEIGASPFFAFCGIGNPQAFFDDLGRWHIPLAGKRKFRDHHRYSARDLENLANEAQRAGALAFVTTEKDGFNIEDGKAVALPIFICVIDLVFAAESEFVAALERKIISVRGAAA